MILFFVDTVYVLGDHCTVLCTTPWPPLDSVSRRSFHVVHVSDLIICEVVLDFILHNDKKLSM